MKPAYRSIMHREKVFLIAAMMAAAVTLVAARNRPQDYQRAHYANSKYQEDYAPVSSDYNF